MGIAVRTFIALVYFGFILLIALFRPTLSVLITEGLSVGVALGAGVIVITWATTWFYVRWTNERIDAAILDLRGEQR